MFSKFFTLCLSAFIALVFTAISSGQSFPFFDDFEAHTVSGQLACQDPVNWTTWNENPCDAIQDPYISDNYAYSGTNSVVIVQDNDLVKPLGSQTTGKWDISFRFYIPAGKEGYFNCMSSFFVPPGFWALQVGFNADGTGGFGDGSLIPHYFTYLQDTWIQARVVVDLDNDIAEYSLDGERKHIWQWTINGGPLQLDVVDYYGDSPAFEMYIDDFQFGPPTSVEDEEIPEEYALYQNYPNPFNPSTKIKYAIRERSLVELKIYDLLGREVNVILNEEQSAGSYEVEFSAIGGSASGGNAYTLPSGIYFYRLQAGSFVETKKMLLLK